MTQDLPLSQSLAIPKRFTVHSDQLKAAGRAISLPKRSNDTIVMTLSADAVRLCVSTSDNGFSASMAVNPLRPLDLAEDETISFEIPKELLVSWSKHYDCELSFELDKDEDSLTWQGTGRAFQMRTVVRFIELPKDIEEHRPLANLHARAVRDAIRHAATLIEKRSPNAKAFDGLEVSGGCAKSGYRGGLSLYKSGDLPEALSFVLPKRDVTNALSLIGRMEGVVEITETDHSVFIQDENTEFRWTKAGRCPSLDRAFCQATKATFNVMRTDALSSVLIASIGSDRGRVVLEQTDQGPSLSIVSIAPTARYSVVLDGYSNTCDLEPGAQIAFNVNLTDLHRVLFGVRTSTAEISIGQQFLLVKSSCETYEEFSLLAGLD